MKQKFSVCISIFLILSNILVACQSPSGQIDEIVVNSKGISKSLADGFTINVPTGALYTEDSRLDVQESEDISAYKSEDFTITGKVYEIHLAEGKPFRKPVELKIPYDENKIPGNRTEGDLFPMYYQDGQWTRVHGVVDREKDIITVYAPHNDDWSTGVYTTDRWSTENLDGDDKQAINWFDSVFNEETNQLLYDRALQAAEENVRMRRRELDIMLTDLDWAVDDLAEYVSYEAIKKDLEEIGEHVIIKLGSESMVALLTAWGGKEVVISIAGTPVLIWGVEIAAGGYGLYRAFQINMASGDVIYHILQVELAIKRLEEAEAYLWKLQNPDATTIGPIDLNYLSNYYVSLPDSVTSQTSTSFGDWDADWTAFTDEYFQEQLASLTKQVDPELDEKINEVTDLIDVGWGGTTNTVIVIDVSGSMDDYDPSGVTKMEAAKKAAKQMVEQLNSANNSMGTNHQIAVVSFDDRASIEIEFTDNTNRLNSAVESLYPDGGTEIGKGLSKANEVLSILPNIGGSFIILMTDGKSDDNINSLRNGPLAEANDRQTCVMTVGFGNDADLTMLQDIANSSVCGSYYSALDAFELSSVYSSAAAGTTGHNIQNMSDTVEQDQNVLAGTYEVGPDQAALVANLIWEGSTLNTEIYNPNGELIEVDGRRVKILNTTPTSQSILVIAPEEGTWLFRVVGVDVPQSGGERYNLTASTISMARLRGEEVTVPPTSLGTNNELPSNYTCPDLSDVRLRMGYRAKLVFEKVNLRTYAQVPDDYDSNIVTELDEGTLMTVTGGPECSHDGTWWEVKTDNGEKGWLREFLPNNRLLDIAPSSSTDIQSNSSSTLQNTEKELEDFVVFYWELVTQKDWKTLMEYQSQAFKKRNGTTVNELAEGFQYTSNVKVTWINVVQSNSSTAIVEADLIFTTTANTTTERSHRYTLIKENGHWILDKSENR